MTVLSTSECTEKISEIDTSELDCNKIKDGGVYFITAENGNALKYDISSRSFKAEEYCGTAEQKFIVRKAQGKYTVTPYAEKDHLFEIKESNKFYISCTFYGKISCKVTSSKYHNMTADGEKIEFCSPDSYSAQNRYFTEAESK